MTHNSHVKHTYYMLCAVNKRIIKGSPHSTVFNFFNYLKHLKC